MMRALIFDFDGLILETEGPSYQSWVEVYQSFGHPLPFSTWATTIGTTQADFNPRLELERLAGDTIHWEQVEAARAARENTLIEAQSILPGVEAYLQDAVRLGLKIGLASSSSRRWVTGHLTRLGLLDYFDCICVADDVEHVKPNPELYLTVLRKLDTRAGETIALEDSPLGIQSAKRAGIFCVAVPNPITRNLSLGEADLQLGSLAELPLEQLLAKIKAH